MATPVDLAAIFASAWTAGGGSRPSEAHAAQLAELYRVAKRSQPELDERDFAIALAGLAPGPEGLDSFFGSVRPSKVALEVTLARGTQGPAFRPTPPAFSFEAPRGDAPPVVPSPISGVEATSAAMIVPARGDGSLDETLARGTRPSSPGVPTPAPRRAPDRYRVIRQLGAGAMGVVWEAEDTQLHRKVALKWITPSAASDKGYRTRLFREARALAQLHHPNVVAVYDVGEVGDELFLALELIEGTTAREWMDAKPRGPEELLAAWRQAGEGLAAVHAAGLVHRDIKPENVFVSTSGRMVVGDFGLATGELGDTVATNLTATGAVVGTPLYMPPEQLHGSSATPGGDQFSLCVCIWEALAGKRPFESTSIAGLAVAMLKPPVIPAGVDRRIFGVLQRGLATDAGDRWPDVSALLAALVPAPKKSRGGMIAMAAAVVVGAVGVITVQKLMSPQAMPAPASATPASPTPPQPTPTGLPPRTAADPSSLGPPLPVAPPSPTTTTPTAQIPPTSNHVPTHATPIPHPPVGAPTRAHPTQPEKDNDDNTQPTHEAWNEHYNDSINALMVGDGKKCLALIADSDAWPKEAYREKLSVDSSRGSCMMAAGDCAGGHAEFQRFGAKHKLTAEDVERRIAEADARFCKLDDEPRSQWPVRAAKRLEKLAYARQSCKPVLDFIAKHNLVLPRNPMDPDYASEKVFCFVADGNCTDARALFLATRAATAKGDMLTMANHSFDLSYPTCAGN